MQLRPLPSAAKRMAILILFVVAIDATVAFFAAKPQIWCAIIPALIPVLTPAVIFSWHTNPKAEPASDLL